MKRIVLLVVTPAIFITAGIAQKLGQQVPAFDTMTVAECNNHGEDCTGFASFPHGSKLLHADAVRKNGHISITYSFTSDKTTTQIENVLYSPLDEKTRQPIAPAMIRKACFLPGKYKKKKGFSCVKIKDDPRRPPAPSAKKTSGGHFIVSTRFYFL